MKLYERFADRGFHTSIVTSFGIDFDAYENAALSRLQGNECRNNVLIVDQRMLTLALDGGASLPRMAGRSYSVAGVNPKGVFHPKIFLQIGRKGGRLIIGSANMTASGMAGNLEIAAQVRCGLEDSGEAHLIASAWQYISNFFKDTEHNLHQHFGWMLDKSPWLMKIGPTAELVTLIDGSKAAFLSSGKEKGIAQQFVDLIAQERVRHLLIISPYWDEKLQALRYLTDSLKPDETSLLIEPNRQLFPGDALNSFPNVNIIDFSKFKEGRFVHAKMILAQTDDTDHVLYGSANCTIPALGQANYTGSNEEACLYRRLPKGAVLTSLELEKFLSEPTKINFNELKPVMRAEIDLEKASIKFPGHFECNFDRLTWYPPSSLNINAAKIELLDNKGQILPYRLDEVARDARAVHFLILELKDKPAFAYLKFSDSSISAPAIVSLTDALRSVIREPRSKRTENILGRLDGNDDEDTLMHLLEIMNELEVPQSKREQDIHLAKGASGNDDSPDREDPSHILDYESFISGRQVQRHSLRNSENSFVGKDLSSIRGFLNRFFSLDMEEAELSDDENDGALWRKGPTLISEDIASEGSDVENYDNFTSKEPHVELAEERIIAKQRRADQAYIIKSIDDFNKKMKLKAQAGKLDASDILRLRSILSVVATCGWNEIEAKGKKQPRGQVLTTVSDTNCWPRIMGQILFSFFSGKNAAIHSLKVEDTLNGIPPDFIECWATCVWCIQACNQITNGHNQLVSLRPMIPDLMTQIYTRIRLHESQLTHPDFLLILEAMNKRFAQRLGLDGDEIIARHKSYISAPFQQNFSAAPSS